MSCRNFFLAISAMLFLSLPVTAQEEPAEEETQPGTLGFEQGTYEISETGGSITITVQRSGGSDGEVTVQYSATGDTAVSPDDFEAREGTLTFSDGATTAGFSLDIVDTGIGSADKTVDLALSNPTGGAALAEPATAVLTIRNAYDDFTAGLEQIETGTDNIQQPGLIDLAQNSPFDAERSLNDLISELEVIRDGELGIEQNAGGIATITLGRDAYHFRPRRLVRSAEDARQGLFVQADGRGRFVLPQGLTLHFVAGLIPLTDLQSTLASADRPELEINEQGVITVQINQSAPPLEIGEDGETFINNRYYDRYAVRPSLYSLPAPASVAPGVWTRPHPYLKAEATLALVYGGGDGNRYQMLNASPLDPEAFVGALENLGASNVRFHDHGRITVGNGEALVADFLVHRLEPGTTTPSGLRTTTDRNGDGTGDFRMVYDSGHEQIFYYFPDGLE